MALQVPVQPRPAQAPRFGLLASADPPADNNDRWLTNGIAYSPEGCNDGVIFDPCDTGAIFDDGVHRPAIVRWMPYPIAVEEDCSLLPTGDDREARVTRQLAKEAEKLVGHELWTGTFASTATTRDRFDANGNPVSSPQDNPYPNTWLAHNVDAHVLSPPGTAVGLVHALACLEQYLGEHNGGQQGMIHCTAQVLTHWASFRLLRREGNRILTMLDTVVVASPGYPGTGPHGQVADNDVWAYATDMVTVRRGPVNVYGATGQQIDRANNDQVVLAMQPYLAEWERCRHGAIQLAVSVCGDTLGS